MTSSGDPLDGTAAIWSWRSPGWSRRTLRVGLVGGGTTVVVGLGLTLAIGGAASVAGMVLMALGGVVVLTVVLHWTGREELRIGNDGELVHLKGTRPHRSLSLRAHPEVAIVRTTVRRTILRNGQRRESTTDYLCVAPSSEVSRIDPRHGPPPDLVVVAHFPPRLDGDLRAALERFTAVQSA